MLLQLSLEKECADEIEFIEDDAAQRMARRCAPAATVWG